MTHVRHRTLSAIALLVAGAGLAAPAAAQVELSGAVNWTDNEGNTHVSRRALVEVWDATNGRMLTSVRADTSGVYAVDPTLVPAGIDIYVRAVADSGEAGFVAPPAKLNRKDAYHIQSATSKGVGAGKHTINVTIGNGTTEGQAFSILDALRTGNRFGNRVRGLPAGLPTAFPVGGTVSYFNPGDSTMHVLEKDRWDWDVVLHEYGHYLAHLDKLDDHPGGKHTFGRNNITGYDADKDGKFDGDNDIPQHGKDKGTRLAWGEGLATYLGLAAEHTVWVPPNLKGVADAKGVRDLFYDDTEDSTWHVSIESNTGPVGVGEGDEASVMRILWDLADPAGGKAEPKDRVAIGHEPLYKLLDESIAKDKKGNLTTLNHVWKHLDANAKNDAERKDYGAIFEDNGVSPKPAVKKRGDPVFRYDDEAPIFSWESGNDGANDVFDLMIFDAGLDSRWFEFGGLAEGLGLSIDPFSGEYLYDMNSGDWSVLTGYALAYGPTVFSFVVSGYDSIDPDGAAYSTDLVTGGYWSDAYSFTVIPTPGSVAILGLGVLLSAGRRSSRA